MYFRKLKVTVRNAWNNGVLSFAKIFGLSLSFLVILFSAVYVYYETGFDKDVPDYDRIYRCLMTGQFNEEVVDYAVTSPEQAAAMVGDIPEIVEVIRIQSQGIASINYKNQNIDEAPLYLADPNFFSFFGFNLKTNQEYPLASENNIIIARSIAENHFGSIDGALGESVKIRNDEYIITGIFDDPPANFHLRVEMIMSIEKSNPEQVGWDSQNYYTYFKTSHEDIDLEELNFKISKTVYTHSYDQIDGAAANSWDDLKFGDNIHLFFTAEPLSDIHFSTHKFEPAVTSNKTYVYGAIVLALLVLSISSVNFINLTIANISTRHKEVGIRKTIGAHRNDILIQFLNETAFFVIISFVIAALFYITSGQQLARDIGFEAIVSNKQLIIITVSIFLCLLLFVVTVTILPVGITSAKKILNLIKGESNSKKHNWGNNSFILVQFVLSALIILSSVVVQKQVNYITKKDRGYDTENVMMLSMWIMNPETRKSFVEKLKTYSAIQSVSTGGVYFGQDFGMNGAFFETEEQASYFHPSILPVDDQFLKTFNLKMTEGRYFEKERQTDFDAVILNEAAAREYTGEGSILSKDVIFEGNTYRVIGIVKDFNFRSLHHVIEPLLMTRADNPGNVYVKIRNSQIAEVVRIVQNLWKEFNISFPFNYEFHDEVIAEHYIKDQQAKKLLLYLTIVSVVIACVGLYAISFFSINKRIKEIGIRKVNGAKVSEILTMLNKNFIKWVAIAFVVACPIAYYAMHKWLENFAYKTDLSWWIFILAGALALGIALLTVSWQSWRAATRNPVEALRYE